MKGILVIVANEKLVSHPLFDANPRTVGFEILQWVKNNKDDLSLLEDHISKLRVCRNMKQVAQLAARGQLPHLTAGAGILEILLRTDPHFVTMVDSLPIAEEDPDHCWLYELDLDRWIVSVYRSAIMQRIPADCWTINRRLTHMSKAPDLPFFADAASWSIEKLPSAKKYLGLWPAHNMAALAVRE